MAMGMGTLGSIRILIFIVGLGQWENGNYTIINTDNLAFERVRVLMMAVWLPNEWPLPVAFHAVIAGSYSYATAAALLQHHRTALIHCEWCDFWRRRQYLNPIYSHNLVYLNI
jgi:hypothetical protein